MKESGGGADETKEASGGGDEGEAEVSALSSELRVKSTTHVFHSSQIKVRHDERPKLLQWVRDVEDLLVHRHELLRHAEGESRLLNLVVGSVEAKRDGAAGGGDE